MAESAQMLSLWKYSSELDIFQKLVWENFQGSRLLDSLTVPVLPLPIKHTAL